MALVDRIMLPPDSPGAGLFRANVIATAAFTVAAVVAVAVPGIFRIPFAALSCVLFVVGTVAFLAAYGGALSRSRTEAIAVAGIYGMSRSCPAAVRRRFHAATAVQTIVAIATASFRPFTAQAFGILVPMLGLGLGGLWAARHGVFDERDDPRRRARTQVKEAFDE